MQPDRSAALSERLLVLTLALEAALSEDNFPDAQALFEQRSIIIQELEQTGIPDSFLIQKVQQIDKRIEAGMVAKTQAIANELRKGSLGMVAHRAYQAQGSKRSLATPA